MKLEPILRGPAVDLLARTFKFHAGEMATRTGAVAEHLRAAVTLRAIVAADNDYVPVRANVVSREVHTRLQSLWDFDTVANGASSISDEIDALKNIGDLLSSADGVYPSTFRCIDISGDSLLLLGGIPVQALPLAAQNVTTIAGRVRLLTPKSSVTPRDLGIPKLALADWLGLPFADLEQWSRSRIAQWNREAVFSGEIENALIYWNRRWISVDGFRERPREALYRQELSVHGHTKYRYAWSVFQPDKALCFRLSRCTEIERDDARRIQTYLDLKTGGTIIKLRQNSPIISLTVPRPLPAPESRLLLLGWQDPLSPGQKPWPRTFHFALRLLPLLTAGLTQAGYRLQQTN